MTSSERLLLWDRPLWTYDRMTFLTFTTAPLLIALPWQLTALLLTVFWHLHRRAAR